MAVSQSKLAKHWGISRSAVKKRVKQGCPLNSIRAAELWWEKRILKRAPTTGPNVGKFADKVQSRAEEPDPLEPIDGVKRRGRPITPNKPSRSGDSLRDALNNAITVQERAFQQVEKALINGASSMSALLHVHTKALEARFMAETAYREELERRGLVIDRTIMNEMVRRTMEPVLRRIRRLPQERGPECYESGSAINAVNILEKEVNSIIKIGRKALEDFVGEYRTTAKS